MAPIDRCRFIVIGNYGDKRRCESKFPHGDNKYCKSSQPVMLGEDLRLNHLSVTGYGSGWEHEQAAHLIHSVYILV